MMAAIGGDLIVRSLVSILNLLILKSIVDNGFLLGFERFQNYRANLQRI